MSSLQRVDPDAGILMAGTTDGFANIHGANERVLLDQFGKAALAEADRFGRLAAASGGGKR